MNPKETVPPTGTALLQFGAAMVYFRSALDWMLAFQIEEMRGSIVNSTLQSEIGLPVVFVTTTSAWNPFPQSSVTVKAAWTVDDNMMNNNAIRRPKPARRPCGLCSEGERSICGAEASTGLKEFFMVGFSSGHISMRPWRVSK